MPEPLHRIACPARPGVRAGTLLVMLPGAYDRPEDFVERGFERAARAQGLAADLCFVETDLTAVADGALIARLHTEVVAPARAAGYARVLTGGISLGALTALAHADAWARAVDGLVLLAPYPGNRQISGEIAAAGGLAAWDPGALAADEHEKRGWRTVQRLAARTPPPLWLGFGADDRFAPALRMMAAVLPDACELPGGHDWPTWIALWDAFLGSEVLA